MAINDTAVLMGARVRIHETAELSPLRAFNGTLPESEARLVRIRARQIDLYGKVVAPGPNSTVSIGADVVNMKRVGQLLSGGQVEVLGREEMAARGDSLMSVRAAAEAKGGYPWVHEQA